MTSTAPIRLVGHSGAQVLLLRDPAGVRVRKMAGHAAQNDRLRAQSAKQAALHADGMPSPAVLGSGEDDGRFFFDMAYLPGMSVAHQCAAGDPPDRDAFAALAIDWLRRFRAGAGMALPAAAFHRKLEAIGAACQSMPLLAPLQSMAAPLIADLTRRDWAGFLQSDCHGDMTLENVLVQNHRFSFIDMDAPDLPSYAMDAGKLFQDLAGLWCLRHLAVAPESPSAVMRLVNARLAVQRLAAPVLQAVQAMEPALAARLPQLAALNLLRALPYCTDQVIACFVLDRATIVARNPIG